MALTSYRRKRDFHSTPEPRGAAVSGRGRRRFVIHKHAATRLHYGRASGVKLTNPDKVLYPEQGLTKLDLARYYHAASSLMIQQIAERPLTLLRCPEGRGKKCFCQKHPLQSVDPSLGHVKIRETGGAAI